MTTLTFKRDDLIAALEARRAWAERTDKERLAAHKQAEKEYLRAFKAAVKDAAKKVAGWTYEEAKAAGFDPRPKATWRRGNWVDMDKPSCPASRVAKLDRELVYLRASRQQTFRISSNGQWSTVLFLLTHDDDAAPAEMC